MSLCHYNKSLKLVNFLTSFTWWMDFVLCVSKTDTRGLSSNKNCVYMHNKFVYSVTIFRWCSWKRREIAGSCTGYCPVFHSKVVSIRSINKPEHSIGSAVAALPWYNICIVLQVDQCRYLITVLTTFIHYMTEMHINRHIVDQIYMHMFKFIYRSYRYTY